VKKPSSYKVQIKIGDAEVNVEGAESGVVRIVEAVSDVLRGSRKLIPSQLSSPSAVPVVPTQRTSPADIRSFFEEKQPSSDIEAAAAAAYYNQYLAPESQRKEAIDSDSLTEAFRLAKRPLPAKTIWTLTNARNAGYLDSVGEGGQFRLNAVGYNLVEHGMGKGASEKRARKKPRRKPRRQK
jgi:hypothetical protein